MSLKALAEQRLAALGQPGPRSELSRTSGVPRLPGGRGVMEQRHDRGAQGESRCQVARIFGFLSVDEIETVMNRLTVGRLAVEADSGPEGVPVLLVSDNATIDPTETRVVYRASELHLALDLPVRVLRELHRMKRVYGGTLEPN